MSIDGAYRRLAPIIGADKIEPLAAAIEVENLRQAWKPDEVRVVLLAESHVWTSDREVNCRVRVPGQPETSYTRFVYCLGHGEPSVVYPAVEKHRGTPQYWQLFHDCVFGPAISAQHLTKQEKNPSRRLQAKVELLKQMRQVGLWLVDACVTALYHSGDRLAVGKNYTNAMQISWDEHVGKVLSECSPTGVLIVGKAVANALSDTIQKAVPGTHVEVVSQPNARLPKSAREAERLRCYEFCDPLHPHPTCGTKT